MSDEFTVHVINPHGSKRRRTAAKKTATKKAGAKKPMAGKKKTGKKKQAKNEPHRRLPPNDGATQDPPRRRSAGASVARQIQTFPSVV